MDEDDRKRGLETDAEAERRLQALLDDAGLTSAELFPGETILGAGADGNVIERQMPPAS